MKTFFVLLFCCICAVVFCADDDIAVAIRKLPTNDRDAAVAFLVKNREKAIPGLHAELFPDLDGELKKLGADSFKVRRSASRRIIAMGKRVEDKVRAHGKASTDPEVRARCEDILKAIEKGDISNDRAALLGGAVDVLMQTKARTADKQCSDIFQEYLVRRRFYQKENLAQLKKVLIFVAGDKTLFPHIGRGLKLAKDEEVVKELIGYLVKQDAPKAAGLLEDFETDSPFSSEVKNILAKMDFTALRFYHLRKIAKLPRRDRTGYVKDLEKNPKFAETFKGDAAAFLKSPNLHANGLGVRLAGDQIKKHHARILEIMGAIKENDRSWEFTKALKEADLDPEFILENLDAFMDCPSWTLAEAALKKLDSGKVPIAKLLGKFKTGNRYAYSEIAEFLIETFPKQRKDVVAALEREIRECTEKDRDRYWNLAQTLGQTVKYKGHGLDDWWQGQIKTAKAKFWKSILVRSAAYLNVRGEIALPFIEESSDWHPDDKSVELLVKGSPEHQTRALAFLKRRLGNSKQLYETAVLIKPLLRERPGQFAEFAEVYFKNAVAAAEKKQLYLSDNRYVEPIATHLRKFPKDVGILLRRMQGNGAEERAIAVCLLSGVSLSDKQKKEVLKKAEAVLGELSEPRLLQHTLYSAMDLGLNRKAVYDSIAKIFVLNGENHKLSELAYLIDEPDADLADRIELLRSKVGGDRQHTVDLAILNADPDHQACLDRVRDRALNSKNHDHAAVAIGLLAVHNRLPEISTERMDYLYSGKDNFYSMNNALAKAPKAALAAKDVIRKYIGAMAMDSYPDLDTLVWQNPPLQKHIVPVLMELLEKGSKKEREFASDMLASTSEAMPAFTDRLLAVFQKETDKEIIDNLLWATANVGKPAAEIAPLIETKYSKSETTRIRARSYFALSRISRDAKTRMVYVNRLREMYNSEEKGIPQSVVRMLGLVKEFDDQIHPFLSEVLLNTELDDNIRSEGVWGLARRKPFTTYALKAYNRILKEAGTIEGYRKHKDIVDNVLWGVRQHPESSVSLLPLLQKLPARERDERDCWRAIRDVREAKKKLDAKGDQPPE